MNTPASNAPTDDRWTVRRILDWTTAHLKAKGSETPRLDAEILLAHARDCNRVQLYTQYAEELSGPQRARMRHLVNRRADREPVAYLVGYREFFSLDFKVTPDVLIPRPDTETLLVELLQRARGWDSPRVLDVGTGSGCIGVASAVNLPAAHVTATDVSESALSVARENAQTHNVADRMTFLHGDLFEPIAEGSQFDFIVSNPPYVTEAEFAELQPEVNRHEPKHALVSGIDGLDAIRRLVAQAPRFLRPGGWLLFEIDSQQAEVSGRLARDAGAFDDVAPIQDLSRKFRVIVARIGPA
ncbi:MAG: peptide chain release factor N(5)-glutamine methyltransferase [Planctomycetaceae bacterium]